MRFFISLHSNQQDCQFGTKVFSAQLPIHKPLTNSHSLFVGRIIASKLSMLLAFVDSVVI